MSVNTEDHNWPKYTKSMMVECPAVNGTSTVSPPMPREHPGGKAEREPEVGEAGGGGMWPSILDMT